MYRFQLGLAIVMKRKSSQNLQDTKLNARCTEKIGQVAGKKKRKTEKRENKTWISRRETEETNTERKKENFSDSEN